MGADVKKILAWTAAAVISFAAASPAWAAPSAKSMTAAREGLLQTPLYHSVETYYPGVFETMVTRLAEGLDAGLPWRDLVMTVRPIYIDLVSTAKGKADARMAVALMKLMRDQASEALAKGPSYCMGILGYAEIPELPYEYLSQATLRRETDWTAELLKQVATQPPPPPAPLDSAEMTKLSTQAFDALPDNDTRAAFIRISDNLSSAKTPTEQRAACLYNIAWMDILVSRGDAGGEMWRSINAQPGMLEQGPRR